MPEIDASRPLSRILAAPLGKWRAQLREGGTLHRFLRRRVIRLRPASKATLLWAADMMVPPFCLFLALGLAEGTLHPAAGAPRLWVLAAGLTLLAGAASAALGLPRIKLKAYETRGLTRTALFALLVAAAGPALAKAIGAPVPAHLWISFALLTFVAGAAWRVAALKVLLWIYRQGQDRIRVAIYGAGMTGIQMVRALNHDPRIEPVVFADDNPSLRRTTVAGLPVVAPADLAAVAAARGIDRVLLAMPSAAAPRQARIVRQLQEQGLTAHTLPSFAQLTGHEALVETLVTPAPDLILGRSGLDQELPGVSEVYAGRCVLVTGAGGSIGSELCRQVLLCRPARLVLYELSEIALHTLHLELGATEGTEIVPVLGSVCDKPALVAALGRHGVDTVLHAAAYKHVPLVEANAVAGVRNNVLGTRVAAEAALEARVARFVLISSDKAVRPRGVMGATKRAAELLVRDLARRADAVGAPTRFSMVRFGNVLGSSGSVVPLFQEQIARGGPVTLTHEDVTRYFMTIPEAARLVLVAGSFAQGGDVFVLDMGAPISIRDLARRMIELAGCTVKGADAPDGDIEIVVTGLRPGEKLVEELLISEEMPGTPHPKILRACDEGLSEIETKAMLRDLGRAVDATDDAAARAALAHWTSDIRPANPGAAAPLIVPAAAQP
jgi:FlaA1/EpsC-like NDP-sugar epimerase